jgi:hypothetical protein
VVDAVAVVVDVGAFVIETVAVFAMAWWRVERVGSGRKKPWKETLLRFCKKWWR